MKKTRSPSFVLSGVTDEVALARSGGRTDSGVRPLLGGNTDRDATFVCAVHVLHGTGGMCHEVDVLRGERLAREVLVDDDLVHVLLLGLHVLGDGLRESSLPFAVVDGRRHVGLGEGASLGDGTATEVVTTDVSFDFHGWCLGVGVLKKDQAVTLCARGGAPRLDRGDRVCATIR